MSYLRVSAVDNPKRPGTSFAKTAVESRNTALTKRYAVIFATPGIEAELEARFEGGAIPGLFAAFKIVDDQNAMLTLLTLQQAQLLAGSDLLPTATAPVRVENSRVLVELAIDPWDLPPDFDEDDGFRYQYRFGIARLDDVSVASLVWPNNLRESSDASDYVAVLSPNHLRRLGDPRYVVIENAADRGKYAAALAKADDHLDVVAQSNPLIRKRFASDVVALDRGVREVLGISDGEFALVHRWDRSSLGASIRRRTFAMRSVYAHPSLPLRGDFEKPVCRIGEDAMSAIGAREGDYVAVDALVRSTAGTFERRTIKRRALLIDRMEAEARRGWSSPDADEGYIDCAEFHGIFPPYPTIYIDYFAQKELFGGGVRRMPVVCPVVQVRPLLWSRFFDEASEFAWVGIVAVVAVVAKALSSSVVILVGVALILGVGLVVLRVRRATR